MRRFQHGSLFKLKRKSCPDVWVFRWYDNSTGSESVRKKITGSVTQLRSRGEAEKAVTALRSVINVEVGIPRSICDLAAHYQLQGSQESEKHLQQSKVIEHYLSNRAGDIFNSVLFGPYRLKHGWILSD